MEIDRFSEHDIDQHLNTLAELFKDAIDHGASMSYLPPLDIDVSRQFWRKTAVSVASGEQIVLVAMENHRPVGSVQLALAWQPNGRHRAEVQKLMVHSTQRRRGIATRLMHTVEDIALQHQRSLLILDTYEGSGAEMLYRGLGYLVAGIIPDFALDEHGATHPTVMFYKRL